MMNGQLDVDTNTEGWWCDTCDAYNYFDDSKHNNHRFTIIYEDKNKIETLPKRQDRKFKSQLSPFRYAGGKSKIIPFLASFVREEKCEVLASSHAGGASFELAMLEARLAKRLLLNDLDYGVFAVWWATLNMPEELIYRIRSFQPTHAAYFKAQEHIKLGYDRLDLMDAAWYTLLVNRLSFSGIARANPLGGRNGDINALTSRWNPATLAKRINAIHEMAHLIDLSCLDAVEFIEGAFWSDHTTIFIDPPYVEKGKDLYNIYYTQRDHIRLSVTLDSLHIGTPASDIIVTYDYNEWLQGLYRGPDNELIVGRKYSI